MVLEAAIGMPGERAASRDGGIGTRQQIDGERSFGLPTGDRRLRRLRDLG